MTNYFNTFRVNAAIQNTVYTKGNNTLYTCPANCFAIVNIVLQGNGNAQVGGRIVMASLEANNDGSYGQTLGQSVLSPPIYVGPGQSVVTNVAGTFIQTAGISGAQFVNNI